MIVYRVGIESDNVKVNKGSLIFDKIEMEHPIFNELYVVGLMSFRIFKTEKDAIREYIGMVNDIISTSGFDEVEKESLKKIDEHIKMVYALAREKYIEILV